MSIKSDFHLLSYYSIDSLSDGTSNVGIYFQTAKINVNDVERKNENTKLDWIFNVEDLYVKIILIGKKIICEIPHSNWEEVVKVIDNNT